ncbi:MULTISPECIES: type II secretion system secretin GspD [Alishewanella]|uniref:General secretion pathway protein D n=1 Tax=Alishewanella aestuarii B11 TaxID=1197174 RepID=J1Y9H8_9ALTE|nr:MULTISPECIES: type II secretion system secretin GspD [Alishewanella]EJI84420.1 general secretion pathway protein D [Alishewanella aestuarii B11]OCW98025.1 type II secretion system protein GspD [Alishewanella sp. HH-ZS]
MKSAFFSRARRPLATALLAALLSFSVVADSDIRYSPNFKGTDINEFINIVGMNLKKTIIVDPQVRGRINVRSYDMLTEEQYYQFFLNVLQVYGFAVVEMESGILKVVRDKDAKTSNIPVVGDEAPGYGDEMVTRVVPVRNVSVRELAPLLRQFVNQGGGGHVVNYDPSNVIMMTGPAALVNRLVDIIQRVDKAGDQELEILKLNFASAAEIVRILESIYRTQNRGEQPDFLVPRIVADERTNSVIVSGEAQARQRVIELARRLDAELQTSGNTRVFYLKYAKAEDLVPVLTGVSDSIAAEAQGAQQSGQPAPRRAAGGRSISIEAHADSNSLVITAQPDMMRSLEDVVRQLDIRRAQVLVEAIIVEVFDGNGTDFGVQWLNANGGGTNFTGTNTIPIVNIAAGAAQASQITRGTTTQSRDPTTGELITTTTPDTNRDYSGLAQALQGLNGALLGFYNGNWAAILQAVRTSTNSNVLATPHITTMDNQEAIFLVGQEVPIITGSSLGSNNTNPFQQVQRQEVGIKLKVTPQINEGDAVQLVIEQEVSSIGGATAVDITINKREIKTTVMADDGATIVLGGLIDEDVQESESKVPLLGDIPVLGHLFKSTSVSKRKRNLMVFIRATIVRDGNAINGISKQKYNFIRAEQIKRDQEGIRLMPQTRQAILPEWDDSLKLPPSFEEFMQQQEPQPPAGQPKP